MSTDKSYKEENSLKRSKKEQEQIESLFNNSPWIEKKTLKCEVCENQNLIYLSFSNESGEPLLDGYYCPVCDKEYFS